MKIAAASIVLIILLLPGARGDQSSKMLKIDEMFKITKVDQMQQQVMDQMRSMMAAQMAKAGATPEAKAQAEEFQRKFGVMIADRMSWQKMKPMYVKIYDETFTEEELTGILDFYRSPPGQALIGKMPALMSKSMALAQQAMGDLMPEVRKMVEDISGKAK